MDKERYFGFAKDAELQDDERQAMWQQQREERGFDNTELWSLHTTIAQFILPRLKAFKGSTDFYPCCFTRIEQWNYVLQKMIDGFELIIQDDCFPLNSSENRKMNRALDLFRKYYFCLWN